MARAQEILGTDFDCNLIDLRDYRIEHCQGCGVCGKTATTGELIDCLVKDDAAEVLSMMVEADGIVISSPVRLGLPSDLFVKLMMRTRVLRNQDFKLANKPVGIMTVTRRRAGSGGEVAITQAWIPFIRNGCLVVGGGGKSSNLGAVGWAGKRRQVLSDNFGMEQSVVTVLRVGEIARLIKLGTEQLAKPAAPLSFCYQTGERVD